MTRSISCDSRRAASRFFSQQTTFCSIRPLFSFNSLRSRSACLMYVMLVGAELGGVGPHPLCALVAFAASDKPCQQTSSRHLQLHSSSAQQTSSRHLGNRNLPILELGEKGYKIIIYVVSNTRRQRRKLPSRTSCVYDPFGCCY